MSFFQNIFNNFDGESPLSNLFRVVIVGDSGVYIEGVKSIKSYSKDKIEILLKKGAFNVYGEQLFIKKYYLGDMVICGKITKTERI